MSQQPIELQFITVPPSSQRARLSYFLGARLLLLTLLIAWPAFAMGQQIEFVEKFVLSADRQAALQQLVPGTEEFFFFSALDKQLREQHAEVETMLKTWASRIGETELYHRIRTREYLLSYQRNPQATLDFLIQQLQLRFDHQREIPAAERSLPSALPAAALDIETLWQRSLANQSQTDGIENAGLALLLDRFDTLSTWQQRHVLSRLRNPNVENLVKWLAADLQRHPDATPFGDLSIHHQLTVAQLDQLVQAVPSLGSNQRFVHLYLRKLKPDADKNTLVDAELMREYLLTAWKYLATLDSSLNSLKTNVLFHLLKADLQAGQPNLDRFKQYLELPRPLPYVHPRILQSEHGLRFQSNLAEDFSSVIGLPPVMDEWTVVRRYLFHFLRDAEDTRQFATYFEEGFLKKEFAQIKILSGHGEWERWSKILTPQEYKELIDRVEIEFAETNPTIFANDARIKLDVDIKNANDLVIKIFEINTENYLRQFGKIVDTQVNLDGLIPNWQRTEKLDQAPALRQRHGFEFPELDHPGVYVIDFIGNGKSCRALIQKGRLSVTQRINAVGHVLCVFDENGQRLKNATATLGNRRLEANEDGLIVVPFSTSPGNAQLIVRHGSLATLSQFQHVGEEYELKAGIFIDREQLLKNRKANLVIRPALTVGGMPIGIRERLKEVAVKVAITNHDGQVSQRTFPNPEIDDQGELVLQFQVPPRVGKVDVTLSAKIRNHSHDRDDELSASQSQTINQIDLTDEIVDLHLLRDEENYVLEVLGLSGEKRTRLPVQVTLKHVWFQQPVSETLQSDENGRVHLGTLAGIAQVTANVVGGSARTWSLTNLDRNTDFQTVTGLAGQPILCAIPDLLSDDQRADVALFELRDGLIAHHRPENIKQNDNLLLLTDLAAGDYLIQFGNSDRTIQVHVTAGEQVGIYLVGRHRVLEASWSKPLSIVNPTVENEKELHLKVRGGTERTRVHILATRYVPRFNAFEWLNRSPILEPVIYRRGVNFNAYVSGRRLGDEYRYVIDRQNAEKYPGNMLERPSLLLAPWSLGPTDNLEQFLAESNEFNRAGAAEREDSSRRERSQVAASTATEFANLDYLFDESILLANLNPDEEGIVKVELASFKDRHHLTIVAIDDFSIVQRTVNFPAQKLVARDLRLNTPFDAAQPVAQRKRIEVIPAQQPFQVENILTARFKVYADLKSVFGFYQGLPNSAGLNEWSFLLEWGELKEEQKLEKYGQFASHELNFYLWKKDRPFFDRHVKPYLQNKFQRTFFDSWLLEEDLNRYFEPLRFAQLNPFEKILLAQRLADRKPDILKQLSDQLELKPVDQAWLDRLFDTAIESSALEESKLAEELEKRKADPKSELSALQPTPDLDLRYSQGAPAPSQSRAGRLEMKQSGEAGGGRGGIGGKAVEKAGNQPPADARYGYKDADKEIEAALNREDEAEQRDSVPGFIEAESLGRPARFYRQVKPTEEWVENNYYHLHPESSSSNLVAINDFWLDWARAEQADRFLSIHFAQASSNVHEMLLALAVLDLPAKSPEPTTEFGDNSLSWKAPAAAIVLHQQIQQTPVEEGATTILISENIFQKSDRYKTENGLQFDKFLTGPFATHTAYGSQVVITNPTSTPRVVELLMQIPEGAIAISASQPTRTLKFVLAAFQSQSFEYYFYFPAGGTFKHFPANVADKDHVVATAQTRQFEVRDDLNLVDKSSWAFISQSASNEDVLKYLEEENLLKVDLAKIAFRMKEKPFYKQAISLLRNRCVYNHVLWSYSLLHHDNQAIAEFLNQEPLMVARVGQFIDSPLLKRDDFADSRYDHREYWPLINIRAHQVRADREVLNQRIHGQYHRLLNYLAQKPRLSQQDQFSLIYYLLLQDRVTEALERYKELRREETESTVQFDYLNAYLKFYQSDVEGAEKIANQYAEFAIPRWRDRFAAIRQQIAEIRGNQAQVTDADNAAQVQDQLAASAPNFEMEILENTVRVEYQNLQQLEVNYYLMDAELLFSTNPFDALNVASFSMIRPNQTETKSLAREEKQLTFNLPKELLNRNLLVEIRAGDRVQSKAVYSSALKVQMIESYGQVLVTSAKDGKPLPKTYVKVYAKLSTGETKFYKDGYTDLRGRFDYASQNNLPTNNITRLAILIQHNEMGTLIREANLPKE